MYNNSFHKPFKFRSHSINIRHRGKIEYADINVETVRVDKSSMELRKLSVETVDKSAFRLHRSSRTKGSF